LLQDLIKSVSHQYSKKSLIERQPVEPRYRQHIAGGELVEPDPAEMAARYANATATEGRARANRLWPRDR
jgi:hypothetical protein